MMKLAIAGLAVSMSSVAFADTIECVAKTESSTGTQFRYTLVGEERARGFIESSFDLTVEQRGANDSRFRTTVRRADLDYVRGSRDNETWELPSSVYGLYITFDDRFGDIYLRHNIDRNETVRADFRCFDRF